MSKKEAYKAGPQAAQEWTSIKDRVPDEGKIVIVCCESVFPNGDPFVEVATLKVVNGNCFWEATWESGRGNGELETLHNVTHWMNFPTPPLELLNKDKL